MNMQCDIAVCCIVSCSFCPLKPSLAKAHSFLLRANRRRKVNEKQNGNKRKEGSKREREKRAKKERKRKKRDGETSDWVKDHKMKSRSTEPTSPPEPSSHYSDS